jgi:hypothetical protein
MHAGRAICVILARLGETREESYWLDASVFGFDRPCGQADALSQEFEVAYIRLSAPGGRLTSFGSRRVSFEPSGRPLGC